jgi:hypothetical protein
MMLHLANAGSAAPHARQCVRDRPTQLSNRLVGEDCPRVCEPVNAPIEGSQCLSESCDFRLKNWIFSCLYLSEGIAKRADFFPQVSEIPQRPWTAD